MLEQTQSTTRSLTYRPIFARSIEFTTDLSPETCADRLMALSGQAITVPWMRANLTAERGSAAQNSNAVRIGVERHLGMVFTNAQFVGTSVRDAQAGKTVVRGSFTASTHHIFALITLLIMLAAGLLFAPVLVITVAIIGIVSTWEIYDDYRTIETQIDSALR